MVLQRLHWGNGGLGVHGYATDLRSWSVLPEFRTRRVHSVLHLRQPEHLLSHVRVVRRLRLSPLDQFGLYRQLFDPQLLGPETLPKRRSGT
jgi:hypothetical protein